MAQRWVLTDGKDYVVKDIGGRVNALVITTVGATAGKLVTIRNGGITGTVMWKGAVELANGVVPIPFVFRQGDPGIVCSSGISFTHTDADNKVFGYLLVE